MPKGPSFDPDVKRLAVEVEDHPLEYAAFEGEIPEGEYGAGHVARFDAGAWTTEGDPEAALEKGHLAFELFGEKLKGRWHLVRTHREAKQPEWLLIKDRDRYAASVEADDLVERAPRPKKRKRSRLRTRASKLAGAVPARGEIAPFAPELARAFEKPPEGAGWLHEIKWDGYRLLAILADGRARLYSRNHLDWTERLPELREALESLGLDAALLDGELIAGGGRRDDFPLLQAVLSGEAQGTLSYALFDVLHVDGIDVSGAKLADRKALLAEILEGADPRLVFSAHVEGQGEHAFALACEHGFEGIVSKRDDRPYRPGRSDEWRKIKRLASEEYAVVGYTPGKGAFASSLGALLLAAPDARHGFRYVGRVGTGLSDALRRELTHALEGRGRSEPTVYVPPHATDLRGARWIEPRLVVEVFDRGVSRTGLLRQASLKSIRRDKSARDLEVDVERTPTGAELVSNPDKLLFPKEGITKAEVAEYYEAVMGYVLPEVRDRPLSIVRCPNGIAEACFYQKHKTPGMKHVDDVRLGGAGRGAFLVVRDADGLRELVQFNAIELHPWGARADRPDLADVVVLDLDPGPGVAFARVVDAARRVRDIAKRVGLTSFVRTTGGKGLHVVIPLRPASPFDEVKAFAKAFAEGLAALHPEAFLATSARAEREGKIYVDYLRNARGATAVASFSLRAREGAPVAMPLRWSELGRVEGGAAFDLHKARRRVARLSSHPWEGYDELRQGLDEVRARLSDQFASVR